MRLRDTLMLRFDRNTLYVAALIAWLIVGVAGVVFLAPDLSGNQRTFVEVLVVGVPVAVVVLAYKYVWQRRAPAPTAVAHSHVLEPPDVPKLEPVTPPERQPTDSFAGELERLTDLHERGVLTDEEFKQAKQNALLP